MLTRATAAAVLVVFGASLALAEPPPARVDGLGDPLPDGAVLRLGTRRFRVQSGQLGEYLSLPDGKNFLIYQRDFAEIGGRPDEFRRMDAASGAILDSWKLPAEDRVAGFSPDGRFALLTSKLNIYGPNNRLEEWSLGLYDLKAKKAVWKKRERPPENHRTPVGRACFSPDNNWFVTASYHDGQVQLWEAAEGKVLWSLPGGSRNLKPIGFAVGGRIVVLFSDNDASISLVDRATGKEIANPLADHIMKFVWLSPDGKHVFTSGHWRTPGAALVYETATGKEVAKLDGNAPDNSGLGIRCAVSGDGRTVVTSSAGKARVWDWPAAKLRTEFDLGIGPVERLGLSPDGTRLDAISRLGSELHIYDVATGKRRPAPADGHGGAVRGLALRGDGKLISVGDDKSIRTWDATSGKMLDHVELHEHAGRAPFALAPDGRHILAPNFMRDSVHFIECATGKVVRTFKTEREIEQVAWSPDGQLVATVAAGPTNRLTVWSVPSGKLVHEVESQEYRNGLTLAFSPDSRRLATPGPWSAHIWDTNTWKEIASLPSRFPIGLAFSPDGRTLAVHSEYTVKVWELATLKQRAELRLPKYASRGLAYSPSGRYLAFATDRTVIQGWDLWTGELLGPFIGHDEPVTALAFIGDRLASSSEDSTILVWDIAAAAGKNPAAPLARLDPAAAWRDLACDDAVAAFAAIRALAAQPQQAVALIRVHVKPLPPPNGKKIEALLQDLDNPKFAERQRAVEELKKVGDAAISRIEKFLAGEISAESRKQAERVLADLRAVNGNPERLRQLRAVELLERVGGNDARKLLEELSRGAPGAPLTHDAAETLKRLP